MRRSVSFWRTIPETWLFSPSVRTLRSAQERLFALRASNTQTDVRTWWPPRGGLQGKSRNASVPGNEMHCKVICAQLRRGNARAVSLAGLLLGSDPPADTKPSKSQRCQLATGSAAHSRSPVSRLKDFVLNGSAVSGCSGTERSSSCMHNPDVCVPSASAPTDSEDSSAFQ